jgi:hypothetical protein
MPIKGFVVTEFVSQNQDKGQRLNAVLAKDGITAIKTKIAQNLQ